MLSYEKDLFRSSDAPLSWPLVFGVYTVITCIVVLVPFAALPRPLVVFGFLAVCPGMALIGLTHIESASQRLLLAVALSIALDTVVAGALLYAGEWSATRGLVILISISLGGSVLQVLQYKLEAGNAVSFAFVLLAITPGLVPFAALVMPRETILDTVSAFFGVLAGVALGTLILKEQLQPVPAHKGMKRPLQHPTTLLLAAIFASCTAIQLSRLW